MTKRRQMFGKASSSQAPYLLTVRVFSIQVPHFQGIWEMESPRTACLLLRHPAAVPDIL